MSAADDGFCFYCQKDYETREKLKAHLTEVHKGTIAYYNIVKRELEKK